MKEKINEKKSKKKSAKRRTIVVLFSIVFIIIAYIMYRGNYLEYLEIGKNYIGAFTNQIKYRSITIIVSFIWIFGLMYFTNKRIQKGLKPFFSEENKEMPKLLNKSISFITAAIGSVITSNIFLQKTILFFNSTSFGKTDFIFGHDIGYYLFIKPFLQTVLIYILVTIVLSTLYAAVYYIVSLNTQFVNGVTTESLKNSIIKKQLLNNAKILVIIIAVLTFINAEDLSSRPFLTVGENEYSYAISGAGTSDVSIKVWGYRALSIIMIIAIFVGISAYNKKKNRRLIMSVFSVPIYLVGLILVLIGYNKIFVDSNEYEKEKQYISYNIENTRDAYGINIEEVNLDDTDAINSDEVTKYSEVANNISTTNKDLILKSLNGTLTNKGYYKYTSTKPCEYTINNKKTLVYVTPREVVSNENSYTNATYEYTHGYGVVVTSASDTNSTGDLVNLQKGFSNDGNVINIKNPRIYFGLETNKTIVTNSKNKNEFDYPKNENSDLDNATNSYDGEAGLKLNTLDRMILAFSNGDINLAFSNNINENSKILTNRNVIERAKKIMPYLTYDNSPYLVITNEGNLVWVIDAYTTSKYYPYSQKSNINGQEINYIKNSVKVLVDAYNGKVEFYITDRTDPIAMAYNKAFPDVFMDIDKEIPSEISEHFTYSEFLYNIQAEILKRYHNTEPDVLYRANDVWDIAKYGAGTNSSTQQTTQMIPYYAIVKTTDSEQTKLGLVLPYTIQGKQSIAGYTVGTYENGKMVMKLYRYSSDNTVLGPMQLDTQISQNESISKEIESLNVSGTKLTKNIVVVPINNKLIYVESIYQEYINESDSLPKLRKVVIASGNKMAIGDDLKSALSNLLSQAFNIEVEDPENEQALLQSIIKANKNLKESTSNQDYEMMGKDIKQLQNLIDKLEQLQSNDSKDKDKENNNTINL
ncbi:MAG TPA: UPF0182 family protein [Clostridiaceae bacterium]|nr:UPF0182 family protein [Clostridiaceae bacterium]